jgi:hypothetical protein
VVSTQEVENIILYCNALTLCPKQRNFTGDVVLTWCVYAGHKTDRLSKGQLYNEPLLHFGYQSGHLSLLHTTVTVSAQKGKDHAVFHVPRIHAVFHVPRHQLACQQLRINTRNTLSQRMTQLALLTELTLVDSMH